MGTVIPGTHDEPHVGKLTRIYLPQRYWTLLRWQAAEEGVPLTRYLSEVLLNYVAAHDEWLIPVHPPRSDT